MATCIKCNNKPMPGKMICASCRGKELKAIRKLIHKKPKEDKK